MISQNHHPDLSSAALSFLEAGLSACPAVLADKYPTGLSWGKFQKQRMDPAEVSQWFRQADAICIICGAVSGHLEVIDFDDAGDISQLGIIGTQAYEELWSYVPPPALPTADADENPELASLQVRRGEMFLIGGAPGSGKTLLAYQMAYQMAYDALINDPELRVVSCNVEVTLKVLMMRQLARWAQQPAVDILEGRIAIRDDRLKEARANLHLLNDRIVYQYPPYDIARVQLLCERFQPDLLVVDYLQRISCGGHKDKRQELNQVLEVLRQLASRGIAILALSGLARTKTKTGASSYANSVGLAAFRETSEVEYAVDRAYVMTVEDPGQPQSEVKLLCCKNRHGEQKDVLLGADFVTQTFADPFGSSMTLDEFGDQQIAEMEQAENKGARQQPERWIG